MIFNFIQKLFHFFFEKIEKNVDEPHLEKKKGELSGHKAKLNEDKNFVLHFKKNVFQFRSKWWDFQVTTFYLKKVKAHKDTITKRFTQRKSKEACLLDFKRQRRSPLRK